MSFQSSVKKYIPPKSVTAKIQSEEGNIRSSEEDIGLLQHLLRYWVQSLMALSG